MAASPQLDIETLLPRLRELLRDASTAYGSNPTPESRAVLTEIENLVEDLLDLQDSQASLDEADREGLTPWGEVKSELGL